MTVFENALAVALGKETGRIPVVLQVYSLVLKRFARVKEYDYYQDIKLQLEAKVAFQRRFPSVLNIGLGAVPEYAEFVGPIPTAFGGKVRWMEDSPPYVGEYPIKEPGDVDKLAEAGLPEANAGIASQVLERLEYFYDWFPKDLRDEYGMVDGVIVPGGCVESAALSMGYDKFFLWMRRYPDVIHKWLKLSTDWLIKYCEAIEAVVGPCKVLWIADHIPSMVGRQQFKEFILPYFNKIFGKYKGALRIWHNEGYVGYMLEEVDKIDSEVWHFGPKEDLVECRSKTHFCLQGNIHPPDFAKMTPKEVESRCEEIIFKSGRNKLWLSTGGGVSPGTPLRNIDSMVKVAERLSRITVR